MAAIEPSTMSGSSSSCRDVNEPSLVSRWLGEMASGSGRLGGDVTEQVAESSTSDGRPLVIDEEMEDAPKEHADGTCEPCLFFTCKRGCANGRLCAYCHLQHTSRSAPRPRKQTRDKIKERVEEIFRTGGPNLQEDLQEEAKKHTYAMSIIQGYLDSDELPAWEPETDAKWDPKLGFVLTLWVPLYLEWIRGNFEISSW